MNLDTGEAITTFPLEFGLGQLGKARMYKTASGSLIPDGGNLVFQGYDEQGRWRHLNCRRAPAHKVLASAGEMAVRGDDDFCVSAASLREREIKRKEKTEVEKRGLSLAILQENVERECSFSF